VTIEGAGVTTIVNGNDGSANGSVFYVETSGVTLKKMNIVNTIGAPISTIIDIWVISGLNDILIEENTITNDAGTGIYFAGTVGTNNVVYKNIFDGTNSGNAVETDGTAIVTGTGNYWGSDNGPYIDPGVGGVNPCGDGKHISAHISYDPWMNSTLTSDIYQGKRVISGTFTYPGLSVDKAMGTGITLILKRTIDNVAVDTTTTNGSGYYAFDGQCTNCSYYIVPSSSNPTSGAVNGTDAAQVNSWGVSPYSINVVRFLAGDVSNNDFISHTDASSILQNFVNNVPFIRTAWNFYDKVSTLNGNPGTVPDQYISVNLQRLPDYTTATAKTQDMYAMATGDFNRSFNPSLVKAASTTLELIYSGTQVKSSNQLFDLPLHIVDANSVGAISIILNFPANLVEIQDVLLSTTNEQLNWSVNGNELRIGWYSSNPLSLAAASELITLKLKTTSAFVNEASIKFALAGSPLNELADAQFNVISNAVLSVDVINASAVGISEQSNVNTLTLSNRPNPFNGSTMINYELPFDGNVSIEIYNYLGSRVKSLVSEQQLKGNHSLKLDAGSLPAGVYMATLIVK
ncbi:MAG: T9SS type A sorting domain-containing protein, partial [Bacteroidales bacterium]